LLTAYQIFSFAACSFWGLIAYWVTGDGYFVTFGILGSACLILFSRSFVYFALNDFNYFQNVENLNKKIDRHNKNIEEFEIKKEEI